LDLGRKLVYYEYAPRNMENLPKGVFDLTHVTNIRKDKKKNNTVLKLEFQNGTKKLVLRAEN